MSSSPPSLSLCSRPPFSLSLFFSNPLPIAISSVPFVCCNICEKQKRRNERHQLTKIASDGREEGKEEGKKRDRRGQTEREREKTRFILTT